MSNKERCPTCGRYMEQDADGFYDREEPENDSSLVLQYCDETCAAAKMESLKGQEE